MSFVDKKIERMDCGSQRSVRVDRFKAKIFAEQGKVDMTGENTIFGQIFQQIKNDYSCWKKNTPDDQSLGVNFEGEYAIDVGGPYREILVQMVEELESGVLPLIKKTPNQEKNHGNDRDCFILNEDSVTPTHQAMFYFLGVLIGHCFRSKSCMPYKLVPAIWKLLCNAKPTEDDLNSIDTYTHQTFRTLRKQAKKIDDEKEYEAAVDQNFTINYNGKDVPLCPDGEDRMVNQSNLEEFIQLTCDHYYKRGEQQLKWIKEGMHYIIPETIINLVQWNETEDRCCGMKTLDVEKLKGITEYYSCSEDTKVVKMFWNVFEELSDEDKTLYLRFVWGRSRLPYDCSKLRYKHCIQLCESMHKEALPESHTCFFMIDIPNYENEEILERRLKTAIQFCGEIDNG